MSVSPHTSAGHVTIIPPTFAKGKNLSEPGSQGFVSHIQLEPLLLPSPRLCT